MYIKNINRKVLPEEKIIINKFRINNDPIKAQIFSFNEIVYIMNRIVPFPINYDEYYLYQLKYDDAKQLLSKLTLNYIIYKSYINSYTLKQALTEVKQSKNILYIIENFFDYNKPHKDKKRDILWVYPKIKIKKYISDCVLNSNYNKFYTNDSTIINLIIIMIYFTKYELENTDDKISELVYSFNYPSLVLANINLYMQGIIKIFIEDTNIGIALNLYPIKTDRISLYFNKQTMKKMIIEMINLFENKKYTLEDFETN